MSVRRLRALRIGIFVGYWLVALWVVVLTGAGELAPLVGAAPGIGIVVLGDWLWATPRANEVREAGRRPFREILTSKEIDTQLQNRGSIVIDNDPEWGKLVEARPATWALPLTAVQVQNATPNEKGEHELIWLRVPSRGERQPARNCTVCKADLSWPPRKAKEAIAWTFNLCSDHYNPAAAS